jgi:hypothetical protein
LSSTRCPDTHAILGKTQNAAVVAEGSTLGESALALLIQLVGIRDFGKNTNNHLSAQREPLPCGAVKQFVQSELREYLAPPGLMAQPVRASVGSLHGVKQRLVLLRTRVQTDFSGKLQYLKIITTKGMRFLCQLKQAVSSHNILWVHLQGSAKLTLTFIYLKILTTLLNPGFASLSHNVHIG